MSQTLFKSFPKLAQFTIIVKNDTGFALHSSNYHLPRRSISRSICCYSTSSEKGSNLEAVGRGLLGLSDEQLLSQCDQTTFKSSGPGGQHRNKRETAVRLKHLSTGIVAQVCLSVSFFRIRKCLNFVLFLIFIKCGNLRYFGLLLVN